MARQRNKQRRTKQRTNPRTKQRTKRRTKQRKTRRSIHGGSRQGSGRSVFGSAYSSALHNQGHADQVRQARSRAQAQQPGRPRARHSPTMDILRNTGLGRMVRNDNNWTPERWAEHRHEERSQKRQSLKNRNQNLFGRGWAKITNQKERDEKKIAVLDHEDEEYRLEMEERKGLIEETDKQAEELDKIRLQEAAARVDQESQEAAALIEDRARINRKYPGKSQATTASKAPARSKSRRVRKAAPLPHRPPPTSPDVHPMLTPKDTVNKLPHGAGGLDRHQRAAIFQRDFLRGDTEVGGIKDGHPVGVAAAPPHRPPPT